MNVLSRQAEEGMSDGLLQRIERHLRETGMTPTLFGRRAAGDPRLILDMRNGREPRAAMVRRIERFLSLQEVAR